MLRNPNRKHCVTFEAMKMTDMLNIEIHEMACVLTGLITIHIPCMYNPSESEA